MAFQATPSQIFLARLAVALAGVLVILGFVIYGFSADIHQRIWRDIAARPAGPMAFRFILQPCVAAIAAFHDGSKDARLGHPPYLWSLLSRRDLRSTSLQEGIISTARILLLGLAMDAIYQATVLQTFYPGEMVLVAVLLAFVPYAILRGPFARLARWWTDRKASIPTGRRK